MSPKTLGKKSLSWAVMAAPTQPQTPTTMTTTTGALGEGPDKPHSQGILINSAIFGEPWGKWKKKKKKTFLKEKNGEKKSLLLMSFIISIESFLSLVMVSWWLVCDREAESRSGTQRPTQTPPDTHPTHSFSDTHRSACWLYQTLLLLPAEINLKKKKKLTILKGQKN